jgi:hypothetical protein
VIISKETNTASASTSSSKRPKKSTKEMFTQDDIVHALVVEKSELLSHTEDLEMEITRLTTQLKDAYQTIHNLQQGTHNSEGTTVSRNRLPKNNSHRQRELSDNGSDDNSESMSRGEQSELENSPSHPDSDQPSDRIRQLVHQLEEQRSVVMELTADNHFLKEKNLTLSRSVENLRLELGSRPTVKEFKDKLKEINELETQLRDVLVMRKESQEIKSWQKHLSTHERILIDKKNYELKLWLLESLPKTVMKEVLQGVCRELELNEVSDILEAIKKLKLVIKTVPRMERFISSVCNFIFERVTPTHLEGDPIRRPVMEDILPILKRWWRNCQEMIQLRRFQEEIISLVEKIDIQSSSFLSSSTSAFTSRTHHPYPSLGGGAGAGGEVISNQDIFLRIKSLIEFQREVFASAKNWDSAERYLVERPEVVINSIVEHIQYLFGVNRLEGLIPKLNEVYLFTEEMANFLISLREMVDMKGVPDATVITEIYRIVQQQKREM